MISKDITDRIVLLGPPYKNPKGGIASVLFSYSKLFETFNFISTTNMGNTLENLLCFIKAIFIFIYYLIFRNIRIVHIQGASKISFWRASVFICIAKWFNKKVIYHIHGGGFKTFSLQHKKVVSYIFSKCDVIVALSSSWKQYFEEEFLHENVLVIPNIIDFPIEDHSKRNNAVLQLLFLGKICDKKGIFDLVDIIGENINIFDGKLRLVIGGNGETERLEKTIGDKKLQEIVQFVGWVNGKEKIDLLNNSHVFILPSYIEAYPISILEAMSYHLPIIATNVGNIPEMIQDGVEGYLVEPGNKKQIFHTLLKVINLSTSLEDMGSKGYLRCKEHIPSNVENELAQMYQILF
jgi:glycosyltransferase involved in cell wall biosynthesis